MIEGAAEQAVAADEAGASDGASPLNSVFDRPQGVRMGSDVLRIEAPEPLRALIASCAVHCQVDCCNLGAFDVNAYTMLWWLRDSEQAAEEAARQLDLLMGRVSVHEDAVRLDDFCYEWSQGRECASYLETWRYEFARARTIGPAGMPPEQRLGEAASRGETEYLRDVYRMANECAPAEPSHPWSAIPERRERALGVLRALARLDLSDERIRKEVEYARRVLSDQGLSW